MATPVEVLHTGHQPIVTRRVDEPRASQLVVSSSTVVTMDDPPGALAAASRQAEVMLGGVDEDFLDELRLTRSGRRGFSSVTRARSSG